MRGPADVAVVSADPWFGGGGRRMTEAFLDATREIGRRPRLMYLARGGAVGDDDERLALRARLSWLDALSQLLGAERLADPVRRSASIWVVAPAAHFGLAAARSRRRYACWLATGLDAEWAARRDGLPPSRRTALQVNAPVLRRAERHVLRHASAVYAISTATARAVTQAGDLAPSAVRVLPLPVDARRFAPEPDETWLRRAAEAPVVTFVGRAHDPRKNVGLLLDAFRIVRSRRPEARLRLVGEPPAVGTPLPDGVEVLGVAADVAEALRASTLFVLPSLQEGFGLVAAEALASGVPALVTPSGGPEELVTASRGGRVLRGFDAEELADAAADLLADPVSLRAAGRAGRAYVEREHSPARLVDRLRGAFAELDVPS